MIDCDTTRKDLDHTLRLFREALPMTRCSYSHGMHPASKGQCTLLNYGLNLMDEMNYFGALETSNRGEIERFGCLTKELISEATELTVKSLNACTDEKLRNSEKCKYCRKNFFF
jgi:hypothetical protein